MHDCEPGRAKNQVAQASNSAEALTLEGQPVCIQLRNSLQAWDLEDVRIHSIMQVETRSLIPGSPTTDPRLAAECSLHQVSLRSVWTATRCDFWYPSCTKTGQGA